MKVETRKRMHEDHETFHYDLLLIPENEMESVQIDMMTNNSPDCDVIGKVALSDGYGHHYIQLSKPPITPPQAHSYSAPSILDDPKNWRVPYHSSDEY